MAILPVITAPDKRLGLKSRPVARVDDEVRQLMDDMLETMYAAPGVGLAATQVGIPKRVIVVDLSGADEDPRPMWLANPEVLWVSDEVATFEEGCLSVPDHYAEVTRPSAAKIRYLDYDNEVREIHAEGFSATCFQHEIDHLDGILFIDHLTPLKRKMILRKLVKARRVAAAVSA